MGAAASGAAKECVGVDGDILTICFVVGADGGAVGDCVQKMLTLRGTSTESLRMNCSETNCPRLAAVVLRPAVAGAHGTESQIWVTLSVCQL